MGSLGSKPRAAVDLTVEEQLNLGAYLIRLGSYQQAVQVLGAAEAQEPRNFLVLANLATAHQLNNQHGEAVQDLERALRAWPRDPDALSPVQLNWCKQLHLSTAEYEWYPELSAGEREWCKQAGLAVGQLRQLLWFREVETYQLKLLKLRAKAPRSRQAIDPLFDDGGNSPKPVRFVGENGNYEPGQLAAAEQAKLPKNAVAIVEQLLLWLPNDPDPGLEWLLGELLSATGDVGAKRVFRNLGERLGKRAPEELDAHRKIVQDWQPKGDPVPDPTPEPRSQQPAQPQTWMPNPWQTLAVGFAAGLVVALLGYWQVREILRRRTANAILSKH
jgi:tetratricopeptide (TPR) repeat protein